MTAAVGSLAVAAGHRVVQRLQGEVVSVAVRAPAGWPRLIKVAFIVLAVLAVLRSSLLLVFARRHAPAQPPRPRRPGGAAAGDGHRARVQRGGRASPRRSVAGRQRLPGRGDRSWSTTARPTRTAEVVASTATARRTVIRQPNGGKPSALNTGIAAARHDIVVMVDGDTIFEPEAMRALVAPSPTRRSAR